MTAIESAQEAIKVMSILDLLGLNGTRAPRAANPSDVESIRRIAQSLDRIEPARARHIAALAFVLSRVAGADLSVSEEETRAMERIVMDWADLPEDQAVLVVQIARHQNLLFGGTDNFIVTRELKETATPEEKARLLHCLFAVSAADDSISVEEENVVAQIASELGVQRDEMLRIRAAYRDKRAVMRPISPPGGTGPSR